VPTNEKMHGILGGFVLSGGEGACGHGAYCAEAESAYSQ
jgi:hypothetical protein